MRISSVRYLLREGVRNIWQNRFMALASICVLVSCLVLTGGAYLVFVNIDNAFRQVYRQNVAVVYAEEGATEEEIRDLGRRLEATDNVQSVEFVSKEETLETYKDDIPEATYREMQGDENPMLDLYIVKFEDLEKFDETLAKIERLDHIDDVSSNRTVARTLTKVRGAVLTVGGWIIIVLLLVALFIISNTIKLTVYSRRLEIYIMKSVGATNLFIRIPFLLEGLILGLLSGGIAYGLVYFLYGKLTETFTFTGVFGVVGFDRVWRSLLIGFLVAGSATGTLGSALSMGRYLKRDGGMADE